MTKLRNMEFTRKILTEKPSVAEFTHVVSCFIKKDDRILILKRSRNVKTYKGKWATVSGYVEKNEKPEQTALKEIREETGVEAELIRKGKIVHVKDDEGNWFVHPFLFETKSDNIKIDWEHVEYKWIKLEEIKNYDTVPMLKESLENVLK